MSKCENCKKYDDCRDGSGLTWPCGAYRPIIGELLPEEVQELAKAKEDGRLVVLPCKVGTMVYFTQSICDYKHCDTHTQMSCCGCPDYAKNKYVIQGRPFTLSDLSSINKTVFLTREEAEKALQEGAEWNNTRKR